MVYINYEHFEILAEWAENGIEREIQFQAHNVSAWWLLLFLIKLTFGAKSSAIIELFGLLKAQKIPILSEGSNTITLIGPYLNFDGGQHNRVGNMRVLELFGVNWSEAESFAKVRISDQDGW